MKKKIPELPTDEMVIPDEIKTMFDPEEIKELTMKKIHQSEPQTGRVRKPYAVLLAAALAAVLTATAFAAYRLLISDQFDGYFGELTPQQTEVMEQIGTVEMPASTANGITITPLAVIGDSYCCYAKFQLEAPEGTEFNMTDDQLRFLHIFGPEWEDRYSIADTDGNALAISSEDVEWIDSTPGDNVLEFIVRFSSDMSRPARFNDGTAKILTIKGIWREELDKEYTKVLDGPWSFDIGFYSAVSEKVLDVDGLPVKHVFQGVQYEEEGTSITLRSMSISPLTLSYTYDFTCPDPETTIPGPGDIYIVMNDGSITEVLRGGASWTDSSVSNQDTIEAPLDLDEAAYIQFGNQQIPVN